MSTKKARLAPIHPGRRLHDELRNVHGATRWREIAAKRAQELLYNDTFPTPKPTPDPGLIMVYLEDDDREIFEGVYGPSWDKAAEETAQDALEALAGKLRQRAEADRVRAILAQLGPDDVEAVKARLAELEVDEGLRVDPDDVP